MEDYKIIPLYELNNRYLINKYGKVYDSFTGKYRKSWISNNGYLCIDLITITGKKKYLTHRLVAITFIPNTNNLPVVMHINNNRLDPSVDNLKWGTYLENNLQAIREGRMIVPRPDNRKLYIVYSDIIFIICNGIKEVINLIGFGTDTQIRNYIFRNKPIPYGEYKGFYIKRYTFNGHLLAGE